MSGPEMEAHKKSKMAERKTVNPNRVTPEQISRAKRADPRPLYFEYGLTVLEEGRHLRIHSGLKMVYRATLEDNGQWKHYRREKGDYVGDNINLVNELEGRDVHFVEAVHKVLGSKSGQVSQNVQSRVRSREHGRPNLPYQSESAKDSGREYLQRRGISEETIKGAEKQNFVRYCKDGVIFCGYDSNRELRLATRRITEPAPNTPSKRDLAGSNKDYAPVLQGDPEIVWVVEGGVDALAVQDLYKSREREAPTCIVSGGAAVRCWTKEPGRQEVLQGARAIYLAIENEKDEQVQAETDTSHAKQFADIEAVAPETRVKIWRPPTGIKDVAELRQKEALGEEGQDSEPARELDCDASVCYKGRLLCNDLIFQI